MKNKLIIGTIMTVILASCSGTNKISTNNSSSTVQTEDTSENNSTQTMSESPNTEKEETKSSTEQTSTMAINVNGSTGAMNNVMARSNAANTPSEENKMFKALHMTDEQINKFNSAMDHFKKRQANTASGEMFGSIESERDRQLETILSKEQFSRYKQWQSDNK